MEPVTIHVEPAPVFDLDPALIGRALMLLVSASARLGHEEPRNTLYYGVEDISTEAGRAAQFVRDVFELKTPEIAEKWFGGLVNATRLAGEVLSVAIVQHRTPR